MLAWLFNYLSCYPFRGKSKPEQFICIAFRNFLLEKTIGNKLKHVWFHVSNEGYSKTTSKVRLYGCIQQNMGKVAGVADYIFLGKDSCLALEIKAKKGKLSESQECFKKWCELCTVPYFVAYSLEEAIKILTDNKIIS